MVKKASAVDKKQVHRKSDRKDVWVMEICAEEPQQE